MDLHVWIFTLNPQIDKQCSDVRPLLLYFIPNMSDQNSQATAAQRSTRPLIVVQPNPASKEAAKTFLLVFQRYLAQSDEHRGAKQVPPLFVEGLLDHAEHSVGLDLDDAFHLRIETRCDSTATKAILGFSIDQNALRRLWPDDAAASKAAEEGGLIGFKVARKWDGDVQVVDVRTGATRSEGGHYMSRTEDRVKYLNHVDILAPLGRCTAKDILCEHWIAPHKWWNAAGENSDKKAILVRPSELDSAGMRDRYCPAAQKALSEGYTLFMARSQNDLIEMSLPGRNFRVKIVVAGMMWREGGGDDGVERNPANGGSFLPRSTRNLKFIIPERRCRRGMGKSKLEFQDDMIVWNAWDEYTYISVVNNIRW